MVFFSFSHSGNTSRAILGNMNRSTRTNNFLHSPPTSVIFPSSLLFFNLHPNIAVAFRVWGDSWRNKTAKLSCEGTGTLGDV